MNNQDVLEYDKQIWTTFSIGVVSSVSILYYTQTKDFNQSLILFALILGFSILIYCFFLTCGYGTKKKIACKGSILAYELKNKNYLRARWMGEFIMIIIGIYYLIVFGLINLACVFIPIGMIVVAIIVCVFADILSEIGK